MQITAMTSTRRGSGNDADIVWASVRLIRLEAADRALRAPRDVHIPDGGSQPSGEPGAYR